MGLLIADTTITPITSGEHLTSTVLNRVTNQLSGFVNTINAHHNTDLIHTGNLTVSSRLTISQATGSSPLVITSTTVCANLNADLHDGYHAGNSNGQIPINNGTICVNLNAQYCNGYSINQNLNTSSNVAFNHVTTYAGITLNYGGVNKFIVDSSIQCYDNVYLSTDKYIHFSYSSSPSTTGTAAFTTYPTGHGPYPYTWLPIFYNGGVRYIPIW